MKSTRLLSVLLAVLMVVSTFTFSGCSKSDEDKAKANTSTREIIALNMYILTEDTTTQEAAGKVQMAINEILLPNHKTLLKINYLTEENYWDAVEAALEETDPLKRTSTENAKVKGTENMDFAQTIEYIFMESTTDIELTQPQIDIFVVNDYDKYTELAKDGMLKDLNQYLSYDSKILTTNIYPTILNAAKIGSETYGVPTNIGMEQGEYTYLVYNKDLLDKYGYQVSQVRDFASNQFAKYLAEVKAGEPGVWPLSEPFGVSGAEYYNGEAAFMTVAAQFNYMASGSTPTFFTKAYTDNMLRRAEYKKLGYWPAEGTASANAKYAIRVEKSTELLDGEGEKMWTDKDGTTYVRYLFDIPRVNIEDAFTSVMCVSATSPVPDRAMEIITLFQTNEELANLLQYGIEDVNYQIDERDDTLIIVDDTYAMDNLVTGNTYIKYPEDNDKEYLENSKKANLGSAPSGFLGVNLEFESGMEQSQYELARTILVNAQKAVDNGADFETIRKITVRELENLGCTRESATSDYGGIFGKIQAMQRTQGQVIDQTFAISDDILEYNEVYGIVMKRSAKTKKQTATETESAEGEVSEGETAEGETTEGEAAEGETVEGEAIDENVSEELAE